MYYNPLIAIIDQLIQDFKKKFADDIPFRLFILIGVIIPCFLLGMVTLVIALGFTTSLITRLAYIAISAGFFTVSFLCSLKVIDTVWGLIKKHRA